jgi:hypothetical protein
MRKIVIAAAAPALLLVLAFTVNLVTAKAPAVSLAPAAEIVVTDHGCVLQSGDSVTVTVAHNTLIGFAYLNHTAGQTYTARFTSSPVIRPYYYLRFHGARPWGLWVSRKQFTQRTLHINCHGGRFGNITQPPWAQTPWPENNYPMD